jgi:hypothetical protein
MAREIGVSTYILEAKSGGLEPNEAIRMQHLEDERRPASMRPELLSSGKPSRFLIQLSKRFLYTKGTFMESPGSTRAIRFEFVFGGRTVESENVWRKSL